MNKLGKILTYEEFQALQRPKNGRAFFDFVLRILIKIMLFVSFIVMFEHSVFCSIVIWYLYAVQLSFWGFAGLGHEAYHSKVFSSRATNKLLFLLCSTLTWNNPRFFSKSHDYHHTNTFASDDHEAGSESMWRFVDIIGYVLFDTRQFCRRICFAIINSTGFYPNLQKLDDNLAVKAARTMVAGNVVIYLSIFLVTESITLTTLAFIAPFSGSFFTKVLAKAQHHGLCESQSLGPLKHSRTLNLPGYVCFFYSNMNYHAEHHFAPSIPYYNLPKLHCLLKAKGLVESVDFRDFIRSWWASETFANRHRKVY